MSLKKREKLFCLLYSKRCSGREAAYLAGYTSFPEITAHRLLQKAEIRQELKRLSENETPGKSLAEAGLRRLAFASPADAVRLLLADDQEELDPQSLDLFGVSEIKRAKGGGIEIKFFDRLKALERLYEIGEDRGQGLSSLLEALDNAAGGIENEN